MGIIGGADGPTTVLVSGDPMGLVLLLVLIAAIVFGVIWFVRHKRK